MEGQAHLFANQSKSFENEPEPAKHLPEHLNLSKLGKRVSRNLFKESISKVELARKLEPCRVLRNKLMPGQSFLAEPFELGRINVPGGPFLTNLRKARKLWQDLGPAMQDHKSTNLGSSLFCKPGSLSI